MTHLVIPSGFFVLLRTFRGSLAPVLPARLPRCNKFPRRGDEHEIALRDFCRDGDGHCLRRGPSVGRVNPVRRGRRGGGAVAAPNVLVAPPFLLGEIDLSLLGVPESELASIGPAGATADPPADGPNTLIVDDDRADCPDAAFTSIQAAVDAAGPGDKIKVCPGTYQEQVRIGPGKDGLSLFSQVPLQAIIKAPLLMTQNDISGEGLSNIIAQNGVQIGRGASADVEHNRISRNLFKRVDSTDTASGVLLFETSAHVSADHNDVFQNGVGVDIDADAVALVIAHNKVHENLDNGVAAFAGSQQNQIAYNKVSNNTPVDCYDETA